MIRFYEQVMGLEVLEHSAESAELGVDNQSIIRLESRPNGKQYPNATSLYHLAILLPTRADLGQWLRHFVQSQSGMIDGASDHLVSEALYQRDPEGNGLEMYCDRPRNEWNYEADGRVVMGGLALDLPAPAAEGHKEPFSKMAKGTTLGHVHLQVSDVPQTFWFYHKLLGFENMISFDTAARGFVGTALLHDCFAGHGRSPNPPSSAGSPQHSIEPLNGERSGQNGGQSIHWLSAIKTSIFIGFHNINNFF